MVSSIFNYHTFWWTLLYEIKQLFKCQYHILIVCAVSIWNPCYCIVWVQLHVMNWISPKIWLIIFHLWFYEIPQNSPCSQYCLGHWEHQWQHWKIQLCDFFHPSIPLLWLICLLLTCKYSLWAEWTLIFKDNFANPFMF